MKNHPYKLSVVLPTYNRKDYLIDTLRLFESQIIRNKERVNFIVSDNASTDGTKEAISEYNKRNPFFEYVNYSDHVEVGESISRTNNLATGEFILMWGDDDMPAPYLIDYLLECLDKYPEADLIHYNRLRGRDSKDGMVQLSIQQNTIGKGNEIEVPVNKLLSDHVLDMSFLTTNVFRRVFWENNKALDCSMHFGYEFMGHILHGMEKSKAVYIEYPMCIQRKPATRSWMKYSPKYRFIGIPNMYNDFEKWGLISNAKELWNRQGNRWNDFVSLIAQASLNKSYYRPMFKEIISHQDGFGRVCVSFFFIFMCPSWLYKVARMLVYKG